MGLMSWLTGDGRDETAMWNSFLSWLDSQNADQSTARVTKYEDQNLAENVNVTIVVGTYHKYGASESHAFYVEISRDTSRVVLGRSFFPGGLGTHHKYDAQMAPQRGKTMYSLMVEAEKQNHAEHPGNKNHA